VKILLLITDLEIGGTPTVVRELAIRLGQSNNITVACLSRWGPVADQLSDANVPVIPFDAAGPADMLRTVIRLVTLIKRERFDVVFSFLIHANLVAALASPFCRGLRFLQSIQTTQSTPRWHWRLQSIVHHAAEKIIVPSPSTAHAAMDWSDVPAEKIVVIPNAVEILPVSSSISNEIHGQDAHGTIGFIGRLDPIKRIPDLLAALAIVEDRFSLHIFGDGEDRSRIESEIARLHLQNRVILHGTITDPKEALRTIDVLCLPSAAEGFGLVLIEAMAAGVPVVATNVPGIRDVVKNGETGLLVPVASPTKIAEAIQCIFDDEALRTRLTTAARVDVQSRYSWDLVLPRYEAILASIQAVV
jgi:glycosyltransferase involved in cell wall biosynthesis